MTIASKCADGFMFAESVLSAHFFDKPAVLPLTYITPPNCRIRQPTCEQVLEFTMPFIDSFTTGFQRATSFAACVVCFSLVAWSTTRGEWQNSLKPAGQPANEFLLVKEGKSVRPIRLTANATIIEKNAAAELQHWIEQITRARPAITPADNGPSVRLQTDAALGEEGYRIAIEGDDLVLAGGTGRGVVNAVYALLEEDLGCRFYTNESIKLPLGNTLSLRPVPRTFMPKLRLRDPFWAIVFNEAWSVRNRTNAPIAPV
jgi:hypothetical protein